jgi:hypothetical protein
MAMATALGSPIGLNISLRPKRPVYKPGDRLSIEIKYRNRQRRAVRLLPDLLVYPAAAFKFRNVSNRIQGRFLKYSQIDVDVEQWGMNVVTLGPGKIYSRELKVQVVDRLPNEYGNSRRGLYILFPVSAVALPGPGRYAVTMDYDSIEHPVRRVIHGYPEFWQGKVSSPAVFAGFTQR